MAMAKEKGETVYHKEYINTAFHTRIALQSIHLFQSLAQSHCIFFAHLPLPISVFPLWVCIKLVRESSQRYSNGPEKASSGHCSAYRWREDRPATVAATPVYI